ncbi:MAG: tRNA (adenosine(37)-N6)-dimethylallyltransferase MiaA [Planctomycetota bacterium]
MTERRRGSAGAVLVLAGPTASGKSRAAHELARRLGGEVVVMDSMKVYREMDVATAKPPLDRRAEVRYHLVDIVDPSEDFSVGDYLALLEETLEDLARRGVPAVVSAGTPLYLQAFLAGFERGPEADWAVRKRILEEAEAAGPAALHARLERIDPEAAARIHPRDLRRVVRALEVAELTGGGAPRRRSWAEAAPRAGARLFGLLWDRAELYRRIDRRVEEMARAGLFEEALRMRERVPPIGRSASQCIGYKEIWRGLAAAAPRAEIVAAVQRGTRRLAKHQMTWFRRLPISWIEVAEGDAPQTIADRIVERLTAAGLHS